VPPSGPLPPCSRFAVSLGVWQFVVVKNAKGAAQVSRALRALTLTTTLVVLAGAPTQAAAQQPAARTAAPTATSAAGSSSRSLDEVTVTARRAELAPKLIRFVDQIAAVENGGEGGLARWGAPVCPLVAGLEQREGGVILEHVSKVVHAAGLPAAGRACRPNLFILVSAQPQQLLQRMQSGRHYAFWFGADASPSVIDEFIRTPRPVRVWYTRARGDAIGIASTGGSPDSPGGGYGVVSHPEGASHLLLNAVYKFTRVFVLVDWTRLQGASLGQLGDYVGMVALANIKPTAQLEDAPTILQLFADASDVAPAGLSAWDRAFLRSLYATEQRSQLQRGEIARAMVREIVH